MQARILSERPKAALFGTSSRDDLNKLFLGKDAVAYIKRRTPGPGAYDLDRRRPLSQSRAGEPGVTIGGPLDNVNRVRTGPLAASYRSITPGPGAHGDITGLSLVRLTLRFIFYSEKAYEQT